MGIVFKALFSKLSVQDLYPYFNHVLRLIESKNSVLFNVLLNDVCMYVF